MKNVKYVCIWLVMMLSTVVLLGGCNEQTGTKIGLLDDKVLAGNSTIGKSATAYLENLGTELQAQFTALQEQVDSSNEEQLQALQKQAEMLEQSFLAEQARVEALFSEHVQESIDAVRKANNLHIILSQGNALSFEDSMDITANVIKELDKNTEAFMKLLKPAETATPAQPLPTNSTQTNSTESMTEAPKANQ